MRQYLFGVLIVLLGSQVFGQDSNNSQENRNSIYRFDVSADGINDRGDSSSSSVQISSEEDADHNVNGDVLSVGKNEEQKYSHSGEEMPGDDESDQYRPIEDDVAYWESIYGTEEIPDFEEPPPIDGDTIFMELGDLTDSWNDPDDGEPTIPIKRGVAETDNESNIRRTPSSAKQRRNFENLQHSGNLDYQSMMSDVYRPNFYDQNFWGERETSSAYQSDENKQFYGSQGSDETASFSDLEQQETTSFFKNLRRSESRDNRIAHTRDISNSRIESELQHDGPFRVTLESGSMKSSDVAADSLLNSKQKIIQAKKDLINVAATGGSKAEVSNAIHRTIEAKKDFIDSVVSAKASAIQRKKEFVHSVDSIDHKHSVDTRISGSTQSRGMLQSVLDSKQNLIQAKKDFIHASAAASKSGLTDAVIRTLDAKKKLVDSALSAYPPETEIIHDKKESGHSTCRARNNAENFYRGVYRHEGTSVNTDSKDSDTRYANLQSGSINSHKLTERKHSSRKITTIKNKKSSHHSHTSVSGTSDIDIAKEIELARSSGNSYHQKESSSSLNSEIQSESQISSGLESGSITSQSGIHSLASSDQINLSKTGSSETRISSGIGTIQNEKTSLLSNVGGTSNLDIGGEIGVVSSSSDSHHHKESSLNLESEIRSDSQISSGLELGSITRHSGTHTLARSDEINLSETGSSGTKISSGIGTFQNGKSSLLSSVGGTSDTDIGGKIGVVSSSSDSHHHKESSLNLNSKIQSDSKISSGLELGAISIRSGIHSLASSDQINLSKIESSETRISSGIATSQNEKSSLLASVDGTSNIDIGGEIGLASSSSDRHHHKENSLILDSKIQSHSRISSDLELGSMTSQRGVDSSASVSAGAESSETKLASSSSQSSSEETNESVATEIESGIENSQSSNTQHHSKIEVAKNTGIKSSLSSDITLHTNLGLGNQVRSGLEIEGAINSGVSTQFNTKTSTIFDEKSLLGSTKTGTSLKDVEIVEAEQRNESPSIPEICAKGKCGVTGKLHVDLNARSESSFHHQNDFETIGGSGILQSFDAPEEYEEIVEPDIQSPIDEELINNSEIDDKNEEEHLEFGDHITDFEAQENEEAVEDVIERTSEVDDQSPIDDEGNRHTETISTIKDVEIGDDDLTSGLSQTEAENVLERTEEEGNTHLEEHGIVEIGSAHEFGIQTAVHKQLEEKEDSIGSEKSSNFLIRSGISEAERASSEENKEDENIAIDHNSNFHVSLEIGNLENDANYEDQSSTYEKEFGKHYSNAAHQHHVSQDEERVDNFQCFDGSSLTHLPQDVEFYPDDGTFSNAHCRLINLDVNCSGMTAFMKPECQQLNANLWHPEESDTPITLWTIKKHLSHGQELAIEMQNRAKWLCDKGLVPKVHTPSMLHLINNLASENTVEINQESEFSLFGTKLLQRRLSSDFDVTPNSFIQFLQHHAFRVIGTGLCHVRPKRCPVNQMYRSFDGSCNNQDHPTWGKSNTAFARILPARYSDGVHEPPRSVTGRELPNPRTLSVHCFSRKLISNSKITLAVPQWGQILSHDFSLQTIDQTFEGGIQCCDDGKRQLPKNLQHHSCLPIDIPADDKFYSKFGFRCMNFVRSMTISREDCTLGPADQMNSVTSYLDASPLYGSNQETCDQLRAFKGGRMLVAIRRGRELLPTMTNTSHFCDAMSPSEVCFLAGDFRVNQNPQLAIIQTILLREHNRIADALTVLNPHWDDERVFHETRKIVIAEYQHITYREWLHVVIGKKYCQRHRLSTRCDDTLSRDYNPRIKPATINSFTTAAFRVFHSMVEGNINLCPANREISHTLRLSNHYFRPQIIERNNNLDDLIRGLVSQSMQQSDKNFHPEITEYLFRSRNEFGMDLETFDIQRGRDHGLPSYNAYRKICGLASARDFDDLNNEISQESIERLKKIYAHVEDIDLIVGMVLENHSPGSILGPVARCLIGEQFYRSKIGDRYFYSNGDQPHSFTQEQFEEIKKSSLARLLCDNGDNIEEIQPQAFKKISHKNPLVSCSVLPKVDLSQWQELM